MSLQRWVVLGVLVLLMSGCLVERKQRGVDIDPSLLGQLYPGISTKSDVLRVLGIPTRQTVIQDREAWVYEFSLEENWVAFLGLYAEQRKTSQRRGVAVLFADDRVHDYFFME
ncbi:MAG TPA: outer membrane protein assembly factor BamE [Alphaproteobacteria bacterium]|nr:outer membrane protein assembly factor BamE [Alphaproteobacteria bacterium]